MSKLYLGGMFGVAGIIVLALLFIFTRRKDIVKAVNPADRENIVNKQVDKLVQSATGGEEFSLGGLFAKWFPSKAEREVDKIFSGPTVTKPEPEPRDLGILDRIKNAIPIFNDTAPENLPPAIDVNTRRTAPIMPNDINGSGALAQRAVTPPYVDPFANNLPAPQNVVYMPIPNPEDYVTDDGWRPVAIGRSTAPIDRKEFPAVDTTVPFGIGMF